MLQQTADTLALIPSELGDTLVPAPRKLSVAEVIRRLGPDATPSEQDSAVQAAFPRPPLEHLSTRPDTLHLPGLPATDKPVTMPQSCYREGYFSGGVWDCPERPFLLPGVAADPLPYHIRTDDYANGILLSAFFLLIFVVAYNKRRILEASRRFFFSHSSERFGEEGDGERMDGMSPFIIAGAALGETLLFFSYTQVYHETIFRNISPYILLGTYFATCLGYYIAKLLLYPLVNATFFPRAERSAWIEALLLSTLGEGILLLPLALLTIYFNLSLIAAGWSFLIILFFIKALLFFRCLRIFFPRADQFIHLILYFCTLEMAPVLFLWRMLEYLNLYLVAYV